MFIDTNHRKMSVMIQVKVNTEVQRHADNEVKVIGIDRGIKNIAVLSNNKSSTSERSEGKILLQ